MSGTAQARGWTLTKRRGPVVLVTHVGDAVGAGAAAAALACAASEPESAALLIDLEDGRPPRSSLVATAGARELEERIAAHLPEAVASRGQVCHLKLPPDAAGIEQVPAALPLSRESAAVVLLPPSLLQPLLNEPRIRATAVLLRADLSKDRALTRLVARSLMARDLRVVVLKRPLGWLAARLALFGVLAGADAFPTRKRERLLNTEDNKLQRCYDGKDEEKGETKRRAAR